MTPDIWLRENAGSPDKIELGLERCLKVLDLCDLDSPPFQIFTVAGTNGKGSTVAILDAILSSSGLLTGRYSSPHLIRFNERILVGQVEQSDAVIIKAFEFIKHQAGSIALSYFEYATIASLVIFAQQGVDVALLEVGLGGRLDACNAVDANVAAITSIALDHQDWLGDDLENIGFEKAGIMRSQMPCILASPNLPKSIERHANSIEAHSIKLNKQYSFLKSGDSWVWSDEDSKFELPLPSLQGEMQIQNAAAAIAMMRHSKFWPLEIKHIKLGLKNIKLAGRLQNISAMDRRWILDVAHNPESMQALCKFLKNTSHNNTKISVVFAMLADKDSLSCIELLSPFVNSWYISSLDSPRSLSLSALEAQLIDSGIAPKNIHVNETIARACFDAQKKTNKEEQILVCGSFYTVGAALSYLEAV